MWERNGVSATCSHTFCGNSAPLPPQLISCVICTLCSQLCYQVLHRMHANRDSTGSGLISDPPYGPALLSNIHPSLELKYCRYMDTGFDMPSTPSAKWSDLGKSRFLRHGGQFRQPTSWMASLTQESLPTPRPTPDWTDVSPSSL